MDGGWLNLRVVPLVAVVLASVSCAVGDPSSGFTSGPNSSFGPGSEGSSGDQITTFGSGTGGTAGPEVMTGGGSTGTGSDPDTSADESTGPGCVPEPEVCNGQDDDCDGSEDNDDPGGGEDCETGMSGACGAGLTACEGGMIVCNPVETASTEVCDGVDNDCDGAVDNGNPEGGAACTTGMPGVCLAGTEVCAGGVITCEPDQMPSAEVCDGVDDDCDGVIDNGDPGGGGACVTGEPGVCAAGTNTCENGGIVCEPDIMAAPGEICANGLDDDCNGLVDDGCGCPFGLCDTPGMPQAPGCDPCVDQVCAADPFCCSNTWDSLCVGQVGTVCMQADCIDPGCAHLVCDTGVALDVLCDPCVTSICVVDPFCCSNTWDPLCVNQVGSICGLTCP